MIRRAQNLEEICASGLCTGCGICESLAGTDRGQMTMVEPGYLRPRTKHAIPPPVMDRILDICPGVSIDGACAERTPLHDAVMGPGVSVWRGHATDDEVQFRAAAGGALTALGMYLIDSDEGKFVLHVVASKEAPMMTAPLIDVTEQLKKNEPFAFIGKPCDEAAVRNLQRHDARAKELIKYTLTLSCAGVPALSFSHQFIKRHAMSPDELETFRYRGYGWPGPTYARTSDGREAQESYLEMWYPYQEKWKTQFRCKICTDATGELADITSVDDWPTGFPERDEKVGRSLVVARTAAADRLMRNAIRAGYLEMESAPEGIQGLHQTQPHQVNKKRGILARLLAMWVVGLPLPRFRSMRVLASAFTTHPLFHWRNFLGLKSRVMQGQHRENPPA